MVVSIQKSSRKKQVKRTKQKVQEGIAYVCASFNNTVITVTTLRGEVIAWRSAGSAGFSGTRKSTPFAAKLAAEEVAKKCLVYGIQEVRIYIWGSGIGRETAIRGIYDIGIRVGLIRDITALPHNGCRSPKRRRV
jgi:small subunit ribosomal protein S11